MTNFEYYKTEDKAIDAWKDYHFKHNMTLDTKNTAGFINWLYEEHVDEIKHEDIYVVYFDANSNNCSGWLDVDSGDTVCFAHFMKWASQFSSREEAIEAAEERLSKIYKLIDNIPLHPYDDRSSYTQEDKDNSKKSYKYHILKIDTLSIANRNIA